MEDRKSVSCNNQVENCRRDFQLSDSMNENVSHSKMKQYRRDFLLQLRLHPLSLQKPGNLPDLGVVKEKLYLHSIIDSSSSSEKCMDLSSCPNSLKSEYCNMKHEYSLLPHYYNRLYPYCFSHVYNGPYQNSSKFRSPFHTYCNPLKKHCVTSHSCYKDFPDECVWAKRSYSSSEDMWSCYPSHVNANFTKKKESLEAVPKSRKKLPIIDPVTGKNVLEAVTAISSEKQTMTYSAEGNAECSENYNDISEDKYAGDCFCNADVTGGTSLNLSNEVYQETVPCSSEDKMYYEKIKDGDTKYQAAFFDKTLEEDSSFDEVYDSKTALTDSAHEDNSAKEEVITTTSDFTAAKENMNKIIKNNENLQDTSEANRLFNKQVPKIHPNKAETNSGDIHGNCQAHYRKDCNFYFGKENVSKQSDVRDSLKQLREEIYSLRQEQQKMAILQSFLRYKKYQLEESARNLDEKRIEIANWECTLFNKAKRLHDKELWLDSRSEILFNKAQQLSEREKILNKEEGKVSRDSHNSRNGLKEGQFSEKKFAFDNNVETAWDEISGKVQNIYDGEENNNYTYFSCGSNPNKISESSSNVEKCKSEVCSLDELERNIVLIEKMNSSNEVGDTCLENKTELASSSTVQKKDDSTSRDSLGYSKGRRYLPEHIKYWLNKRDKNAL